MARGSPQPTEDLAPGDHLAYMRYALSLARCSPPKPTNYRVGAVLIDAANNKIVSTGFTLELPGNTHAEQCCFDKLAYQHNILGSRVPEVLPKECALYTTMEPCSLRLSGNLPCVDRILGMGGKVKTVYVGVKEPDKFVGTNEGRRKLDQAGVEFVHVEGMEDDILEVATAGHGKDGGKENRT